MPAWFPGTRFKRFANEGKKYCTEILEGPFKNTKNHWVRSELKSCFFYSQVHSSLKLTGNAAACYVTRLFDQFGGTEISEDKEQVIKETSAVLYAGKSESRIVGDENLTFSIAGTDSVRAHLFSPIVFV